MQVSIHKRWLLVSLICCTQLILLLGVGIVAMRGIESRIQRRARNRVLSENIRIADQFAKHVNTLDLDAIYPYSSDWLILQNMVEATRLPNDGFVCLVDAESGLLVCHPEIRQDKSLLAVKPGEWLVTNDLSSTRILDNEKTSSGWIQLGEENHLIAATRIPGGQLQVLAHQKSASMTEAVHRLVEPFRTVGLASAVALTLLTAAASFVILRRYDNQLEQVNRRLEHKVYDRSTALTKTRDAVIFGLAKLAESRDNDTGKHLERIRKYVTLLGRKLSGPLRLSDQFVQDLGFASSLHDIGKVGIPDAILLKRGPLTPDERTVIETHAAMGGRCLEAIQRRLGNDDFLEMAKVIAYAHHERWDGAGYPFGISEDSIPVAARIVAVADVYDALTTKRPYKRAFPHEEARQIIVSGSGTQFDPEVVAAFVALEDEFASVAKEWADTEPPVSDAYQMYASKKVDEEEASV